MLATKNTLEPVVKKPPICRIPHLIHDALGGDLFLQATHSRKAVVGNKFISYRIAPNQSQATHMTITANDHGLYDVEFYRLVHNSDHTSAYPELKGRYPNKQLSELLTLFRSITHITHQTHD